jgi:hypothetical protein
MKYFHYLLFASGLFVLASCSSDDDNGVSPTLPLEEMLVGTWEQVESFSETETDVPDQSFGIATSTGRDFAGSITFSSNPNTWVSNMSATYDIVSTITVFGMTHTTETTYLFEQDNETGTWSINEDGQVEGLELTEHENVDQIPMDLDQVYDVEFLSNDRIVFSADFNWTQVDPDTGVELFITGSARSVLQRQ